MHQKSLKTLFHTPLHYYSMHQGITMILIIIIIKKDKYYQCLTSFHRLNRAIQPGESPYSVIKDSIVFSDSSIDVNILNTKRNVTLKLKVQTLKKNSVRFSINEANPIRERYQVKDVLVQEPETVR